MWEDAGNDNERNGSKNSQRITMIGSGLSASALLVA